MVFRSEVLTKTVKVQSLEGDDTNATGKFGTVSV